MAYRCHRRNVAKLTRTERGFTLIEVIVAFAVLVLSLGSIYQVWNLSLMEGGVTTQRAMALLIAQSLLDERTSFRRGVEGVETGSMPEGFDWKVTVEPAVTPTISPTFRWDAKRVVAEVTWSARGRPYFVELETVTLFEGP